MVSDFFPDAAATELCRRLLVLSRASDRIDLLWTLIETMILFMRSR